MTLLKCKLTFVYDDILKKFLKNRIITWKILQTNVLKIPRTFVYIFCKNWKIPDLSRAQEASYPWEERFRQMGFDKLVKNHLKSPFHINVKIGALI